MIILTDVVMYFIRLFGFFVTIFILLSFVGALNASITDNALQRMSVQLAENYFESNITTSRGVFDMTALTVMDGTTIEVARLCSYPSAVEFSTIENGLRTRVTAFGYREPGGGGSSQEFPVWIKSDQRLAPGVMTLTIWQEGSQIAGGKYTYAGLPTLFCAIENAWTYSTMQKEFTFTCPFDPCVVYTSEGNVCFADRDIYDPSSARCRRMTGVNVTDETGNPSYLYKGKHRLQVTPIKQGGTVGCNGDIAKPGDTVGTVLLCEVIG